MKKRLLFLSLPLFIALAGGASFWMRREPQAPSPPSNPVEFDGLKLSAGAESYFHDALVDVTLKAGRAETTTLLRQSTVPVTVWVEHAGRSVVTVGELERFRLKFDSAVQKWRGKWPVPWNAPDGEYVLKLATAAFPSGVGPVTEGRFRIQSRLFVPVPKGFSVLTLEGLGSLHRYSGPDGGPPRVESIAEWADFIGADAVLIQGAESSGYSAKPSSAFPWQMRPTAPVTALAKACHEKGIRLGIYVLSYMVGGPTEHSPDYDYGWHYEKGRAVYGLDRPVRRGISIRDAKRPLDIVKVLDRWASVDGVDFLGLDYIRPVFGGNELVDDFVRDMPGVTKPDGFDTWSKEQKMAWIARGRYVAPIPALRKETKYRTTDQWFWYRAHRTAAVVRKIVEGFAGKKPLWAFTLSWQKGWEHGQDPAMMRDAGIDMNGIMLYEADGQQYRGLLTQWNRYTQGGAFNLVPGNTFDWRLHQRTLNPSGPEEMVRRMMAAVTEFQDGQPTRGLFVHDLARGLRGILGPYPPKEWFLAAGHAMTRVREMHGVLPYRLSVSISTRAAPGEALECRAEIDPSQANVPVEVEVFASGDMEVSAKSFHLSSEKPAARFVAHWRPNEKSSQRGDRGFIALRCRRPDRSQERAQVHMVYVQGDRRAVPSVARSH